jgi:hypothetical protein
MEFKREQYGADVAKLLEDDQQIVEVLRRKDGCFDLIIHNYNERRGLWDDMSATLKPQHFIELGTVADNTLCIERACPQFGRSPSRSCKCHPRYSA